MKQGLSVIILLLSFQFLRAQEPQQSRIADSLYLKKNYKAAAQAYLDAATGAEKFENPKSHYYNAACCFALMNQKKEAIANLEKAVYTYGYKNYQGLLADQDLVSIHEDAAWKKILTKLEKEKANLKDPHKAKLVTSDIHNFWLAFDAVQKDTASRKKIFSNEYFAKSSPGLQDYFATKIRSVNAFVKNQAAKPKFYASIRKNTLSIDTMKKTIYRYFDQLKDLYPDAEFPSIYFVIGRWNSAGTVSDNGLLLGVDQIARSPDIPEDELVLWEKNNFNDVSSIPVIVMHELVHFEQGRIKGDTTLLWNSLIEGMADFICELITGKNPSQRQQVYAEHRRKEIWADFKKEMFLSRAYNWIANGDQESADKPADLGYYMGYEICKSYYEQAADKKQAIKDMLTINDTKDFLVKSKYEEKVARQ